MNNVWFNLIGIVIYCWICELICHGFHWSFLAVFFAIPVVLIVFGIAYLVFDYGDA